MFAEIKESRKTIGDVDVLFHDGTYHLFHLVLPNHDFIAHAVSSDGFRWERVNNAVFIGDPGSWDDLMLWTMHVSKDPHVPGRWRMFYTGLSRQEQGRIQRIGMAVSDDLYAWRKSPVNWPARWERGGATLVANQNSPHDPDSCFPLEATGPHYESAEEEQRGWVSFRDPFFSGQDSEGWLLTAARVTDGPLVRRGCVGRHREFAPGRFEAAPRLHHPGLYDDIEVPNLIEIGGEHYLIGSIREDAKIRYWHTDDLAKPWRSYHDNVLMAQGNYAGRVCRDDQGWLLWNFYSRNLTDRTADNVMPPPKRLIRNDDGLLRATSFEGFDDLVAQQVDTRCVHLLKHGAQERESHCSLEHSGIELRSEAGFQAFVFEDSLQNFRFQAHLDLVGRGKCGIVFRVDPETHDGYYLSLDLLKGVAQLRSWRTGTVGSGEHMMQYRSLQSGFWHNDDVCSATVQLIVFGDYIEFSINNRVILSLVDQTFVAGLVGTYLETAHLKLTNVQLHQLRSLS